MTNDSKLANYDIGENYDQIYYLATVVGFLIIEEHELY